jgi:hypothetical protein
LPLERTRSVSCVAHDANPTSVVFWNVGQIPDCPCGCIFEKLWQRKELEGVLAAEKLEAF